MQSCLLFAFLGAYLLRGGGGGWRHLQALRDELHD